MIFRRRTVAILVVAAMAFSSLVTSLFFLNDSDVNSTYRSSESKAYQEYEAKLQKTFDTIRANYVRPVSDQTLLDGAVRGMVASLGDSHSEYMTPQESKQFLSTIMDSSFSGIGAGVVLKEGHVTIESIVSGSPAEKARLLVNDQIQKVNGKSVAGLTLDKVVARIRGPRGSKVVLELVRGGSAPFSITVTRQDIPQKTVSEIMLKNHIGYVDVSQFSQSTDKEFFKALTTLEKQQMKGLIIDLRGNPGGLLPVVVRMCEAMLPKGKSIVSTQDNTGKKVTYRAKASQLKPYPITLLIDGGSASAAEIMTGAFQQSGRYTVIGTKSYGKGSVQSTMEFNDGSNLKLTIAKWLTPNGTWIDQHGGTKGITPNIVVDPASYTKATLPNPTQTLKQNDNNNDVKNMQLILDGLGLQPGRTDGYFDARTKVAVQSFQQVTGLKITGAVDSDTAKHLSYALQNLLKDPKNDKQLQAAIQFLDHFSE